MTRTNKASLLLIAIVLLTAGVYFPGVSGPFLFDDQSSITSNSAIAIDELNLTNIIAAAKSGEAGPLKRPIPMISFAFNHYFAGGFNPAPFKVTNIIIHCINTILVFFLSLQLFKTFSPNKNIIWVAASVSALWGLHPINLTSVLYIVQRMTSLSTLFSLICIILYIQARRRTFTHNINWRSSSLFMASLTSLILALYSKENAILIPLILLAIELTLFIKQSPWNNFSHLTKPYKITIWLTAICIGTYCLNYAVDYAAGGFNSRPFSMAERILTETRVITTYLSLIFIPRINEFGLFHDDIALSTSLLEPWTTLASSLALLALITGAFFYRKKKPLFALGIGWFFIGHLLESTFFPLEIAHEHRNNFPSIGIIIAIVALLASSQLSKKTSVACLLVTALIIGTTTFLRASQWKNMYSQAYYETIHHPNSAAAQSIYAYAAFEVGFVDKALIAIQKSITLSPSEAAFPMFYQHALAVTKQDIPNSLQRLTLQRIKTGLTSPTTTNALDSIANCLKKAECKTLRHNYIEWIAAIIKKHPKNPFYYYFKGKAHLANGDEKAALTAFQQGSKLDPTSIHPLIKIGSIFLKRKDIAGLEKIMPLVKIANRHTENPMHKEEEWLQNGLKKLRIQRYQPA